MIRVVAIGALLLCGMAANPAGAIDGVDTGWCNDAQGNAVRCSSRPHGGGGPIYVPPPVQPPPTPGTPHPQYPNVVWTENWYFRPAEGYEWLTDPASASGYKVQPVRPGSRHPRYPHVVFGPNASLEPALGYEWASNAKDDYRVRPVPAGTPVPGEPNLVFGPGGPQDRDYAVFWERVPDPASPRGYRYRHLPPGPHPRYPHLIIDKRDGTWTFWPEDGYQFEGDPHRGDWRVKLRPPGSAHPRMPHVVLGRDGRWQPAEGYRWFRGALALAGDLRTEPVPPGTLHPRYPGIVFAQEGKLRPAPGFTWAPNRGPGDFSTVPAEGYRIVAGSDPKNPTVERVPAGTPHPRHPNVVFMEDGKLRPAPGYRWAPDRAPGEFHVEVAEGYRAAPGADAGQSRVERVPANTPHPRYPNVVFNADGTLRPVEGFRWARDDGSGTPRVERVPAGTPHPRAPNVAYGADGTVRPRVGYRWADGAGPNDPRVERVPAGTPHPLHPHVVFAPNGHLLPADGYRWAPSAAPGKVRVEEVPPLESVVRRSDRVVRRAVDHLLSAFGDSHASGIEEHVVGRLQSTFDAGIVQPEGTLGTVNVGGRRVPPVAADAPATERTRALDARRESTARERAGLERERATLAAQPRTPESQVALSQLDDRIARAKSREETYRVLRDVEQTQPRQRPHAPPPPPPPPGAVAKTMETVKETVTQVVNEVWGEAVVVDAPGEKEKTR